MRRALSAVGGVLAGGLLAASGLFGAARSTEEPEPRTLPLQIEAYCRAVYGDDATVYQPSDIDGWRCSVWQNGVWGLEPIDLNAACRWQRGEKARLGRQGSSGRALTCSS